MKKLIVTYMLGLTLIAPMQSKGAVAAATYFFDPTGATNVALVALGQYVGFGLNELLWDFNDGDKTGFLRIGWLIGKILLDEDGQSLSFSEIDLEEAQKQGLNLTDVEIYNSEIDEINIIFNEVKSHARTKEDAVKLWEENGEYLSPESFSILKTILKK